VARFLLAFWLIGFGVQSSELLAAAMPDQCVEDARGTGADSCADNCARCVCCARLVVGVPLLLTTTGVAFVVSAPPIPVLDSVTTAEPRGILHVPKAR